MTAPLLYSSFVEGQGAEEFSDAFGILQDIAAEF